MTVQTPTAPPRLLARALTEVFQPPAVLTGLLLLSPAADPGFPGTFWAGLVAAFFVCVLPLAFVLVLVRLGRLSDHHVSDRRQRAPLLAVALLSVGLGVGVLFWLGSPPAVIVTVLALVGGIVLVGIVSLFWKISGHASALSGALLIAVQIFGLAALPLLLVLPAVCWSRVVLRAHTVGQVVAGSIAGGGLIAGLWALLRSLPAFS